MAGTAPLLPAVLWLSNVVSELEPDLNSDFATCQFNVGLGIHSALRHSISSVLFKRRCPHGDQMREPHLLDLVKGETILVQYPTGNNAF